MNTRLNNLLFAVLLAIGIGLPPGADALQRVEPVVPALMTPAAVPHYTAQDGGMTLSEAVESVRSQANVERVISAETRISGGHEVHLVRVMTRDGKVKTVKVPGRKLK
jgi:hypothetical protein